jgi:hypothetical protein
MAGSFIPSAIVTDALKQIKDEVQRRRAVSAVDPVADGMEYVRRDLAERVQRAERAAEPVTVAEYAARHGVSASAVTKWCRAGRIAGAYRTAGAEWRIPRDAAVSTKPMLVREDAA